MSQEYFPGESSSSRGDSSSAGEGSSRFPPAHPDDNPFLPRRPNYMTVGNGSMSESADALMATLNEDSGYGGSVGSPFDDDAGWRADMMQDRPTPMHPPSLPGQWNPAGWLPRMLPTYNCTDVFSRPSQTCGCQPCPPATLVCSCIPD